MCIFGARKFHSRGIWYEKPAPKTGTRKWSRFMAPVSAACVIGIRELLTDASSRLIPMTHAPEAVAIID